MHTWWNSTDYSVPDLSDGYISQSCCGVSNKRYSWNAKKDQSHSQLRSKRWMQGPASLVSDCWWLAFREELHTLQGGVFLLPFCFSFVYICCVFISVCVFKFNNHAWIIHFIANICLTLRTMFNSSVGGRIFSLFVKKIKKK